LLYAYKTVSDLKGKAGARKVWAALQIWTDSAPSRHVT